MEEMVDARMSHDLDQGAEAEELPALNHPPPLTETKIRSMTQAAPAIAMPMTRVQIFPVHPNPKEIQAQVAMHDRVPVPVELPHRTHNHHPSLVQLHVLDQPIPITTTRLTTTT